MAKLQEKSPWLMDAVGEEVEKVPVTTIEFLTGAAAGLFEISDGTTYGDPPIPRVIYRANVMSANSGVHLYVRHEWQDKLKVEQLPAGGVVLIHFSPNG